MRKNFDESIKNRTVTDAEGRAIGEVEGLFLETENWGVDGIRIKVRNEVARELGLSHGRFRAATLDVPKSLLQAATDTILLRVSARELRPAEPPSESPSEPTVH